MVRFINKGLKSHNYYGDEKISDLLNVGCFAELMQLFAFHTRNFANYSSNELTHLLQKLTIQQGITRPTDFSSVISMQHTRIKELFLTIEIILESFHKAKGSFPEYFVDFVEDINDLFLIHKVSLQIRYIPQKEEFYVEKIISSEISERIKITLENFSKEEKVFEDFKEAIKQYSGGDYESSIERCCVTIEDYLCIILDKKTCPSIDSYYKKVAKKLEIPEDLENRFSNIISYIHNYRSSPRHGSQKKKEIEDLELVNEVIIQFTMAILNYLKNKNEN